MIGQASTGLIYVKMGCDKTSRCYVAIFDSVALVTSAVHSYKICIQGKLMIQSAE